LVHAPRLAADLESRLVSSAIFVGAATALAIVFARRLTDPERIAALAARAAGVTPASRFEEAHRAARKAARATIFYVAGLAVLGEIVLHVTGVHLAVLWIALGTALVLDAADELRARRALGALVAAWSETRFSALEPARTALATAGIDAHVRDHRARSLLDVLGPWAPSEVLVRPADVERTRTLLDKTLQAETAPVSRPRNVAVGLALLVGATAFAPMLPAGRTVPSRRPFAATVAPSSPAPRVSFQEVDDDEDPFKAMSDWSIYQNRPNPLPPGAKVDVESGAARFGGDVPEARRYLAFHSQPGETAAQASERAARTLATFVAPPGDVLAFGPLVDFDELGDRWGIVGVRTYLLHASPVLTEADLLDAVALPNDDDRAGAAVSLELTRGGRERLAAFTHAHVGRRFAIVIDGEVRSAPRILSEIDGESFLLTMGQTSEDEALEEAIRLAATLRAAARGH
jgi:hypothetical protein